MDVQFWIAVIIGVFYFLSRIMKAKAPDTPPNTQRPRPQSHREVERTQTDQPRQLTFEELLREITEAKQASKPVIQSEPKSEVVDYDDNLGEEEQDLETIEPEEFTRNKARTYEVYEEAKREAFSRPSLEESMKVGDTVMQFGKFKVFERTAEKNLLEEYTKQFRDPEGLKKAVVMSEILNRRFQY